MRFFRAINAETLKVKFMSNRKIGTITYFSGERGYGFIRPDGNSEADCGDRLGSNGRVLLLGLSHHPAR
jgi:hypothetical protein